LQDHIVVQTVTRVGSVQGGRWQRTGGDEAWVAIGPQSAFFYGLFQEYGTRFHRAQPFLRPALDGEAQVALGILGRELWAALRLAAPQTFTPATPGSSGLL
jgi:HK97 gp10 family phage protein